MNWNQAWQANYPAPSRDKEQYKSDTQNSADAFFNQAASSEGRPNALSPQELSSALNASAPSGVQNLDSFINFGKAVGLPQDVATRAYFDLVSKNNGQVTNEQLANIASQFADKNGNWNRQQFGNVLGAVAEAGQNSPDQAMKAFDILSQGDQKLTTSELGAGLSAIARGSVFSENEFTDLGSLVGLDRETSEDIYGALKDEFGAEPTVENVLCFASQFADKDGSWGLEEFGNVLSDLGNLADSDEPSNYWGGSSFC